VRDQVTLHLLTIRSSLHLITPHYTANNNNNNNNNNKAATTKAKTSQAKQ